MDHQRVKTMGVAGRAGLASACLDYVRQHWIVLLVCAGSVGLWLLIAKLVVPQIIEAAHRGQSLPILNGLFHGRGDRPLQLYLERWDHLAMNGLFFGVFISLAALAVTRPAFYRRFVGPATPGTLGAIRVLICATLLASALWEDLASSALLPREMRSPMGLLRLFYALPGFDSLVSSQSALGVFEALTVLFLFLGMIGWRTRVTIPLATLCYFLLGGIIRQYTWFYHVGLVPLYVIAVLSLTPCGDGWSVDRLVKIYRGRAVPAGDRPLPVYGWSRYMCWLVVALAYVAAGLSKIGNDGLSWMAADHLKRFMLRDSLNPMEFDWGISLYLVQAPDVFFTVLAISTIVGEVAFALVLFSRLARLLVPSVMVMMHIGILFFQNVLFPDLIVIQLMFYNFSPLRRAVSQWIDRRRGRLEILYDGVCPLCRRTVRLLAAIDVFHRLEFLDFRGLDLATYNRHRGLSLGFAALETEMHMVSRAGVHAGFDAYRQLSLALPALWWIAPLLLLPGASSVGRRVYGYVARNRLERARCDATCELGPADESQQVTDARVEGLRWSRVHPGAVVALAGVLVFCWVQRIEFYPFTAMQMYTGWGPMGPITYYRVVARYESGATSRAPLERAIPALADSRYRTVIASAFSPSQVEVSRKYLSAIASAYNRKALPGARLTELEIQKWRWDFQTHPSDRMHGVLSDRFVFAVAAHDKDARSGP